MNVDWASVRTALPLVAALAATVALYLPAEVLSGERQLYGADFLQLHQYRIEFVHEAWQAGFQGVPGWYPREAMGTPFWSDIQNFPWIPTRLFLLPFPPGAAYAVGVVIAACLSVLFTSLLARALGMSPLASAASGFTFAGSGFFASRVMAGHLPLLEAYPALPLLLWASHAVGTARPDAVRRWLLVLGGATACVCLAGHPQVPFYAVAATLAWVAWQGGPRRPAALAALALGSLATLFVWWPMLLLILRSARVLPLDPPLNDVPFPIERLPALLAPWRDGFSPAVVREPQVAFRGFSSEAVFWETTSYVGLLPWLAAALLVARPKGVSMGWFLALASLACAILSLSPVHTAFSWVPGTLFRSPARLWYVPVFTLSLAAGAGLDVVARRAGTAAAIALLALHATDLVLHARPFVRPTIAREPRPQIEELLARELGDGRVALDYNLPIAPTRRFDDVGFFGAIQLASSYRALAALRQAPERENFQYLSGAREIPAAGLANAGVRFVGSLSTRRDLPLRLAEGGVNLYEVPLPVARALFFPAAAVRLWNEPEMAERLRDPRFRLDQQMLLPLDRIGPEPATDGAASPTALAWRRRSPDVIEIDVVAATDGYVRLLEACDAGWTARVDGEPVETLRADGFLLAARVPAGPHRLRFAYRTPGAATGALMSLAVLLLALRLARRFTPPTR
ncbi:MAG TPA: YfhO family protein [Myxococcota bacterium]